MPRRASKFGFSVVLLLLTLITLAQTASASDTSLQQAMADSQASGRPMLVLGTATWCGPCQRLKRQLATDEALEPLLREYVSVALDIESADFAEWSKLHRPHSSTIPMIFIVSAEGDELYNASGVPGSQELTRILSLGIERGRAAEHVAQLSTTAEETTPPAIATSPSAENELIEAAVSEPVATEVSATRVEETPAESREEASLSLRQRRAESCLRMAQVLASDRPERSRGYAEQVVELAPQSEEAELARELLTNLQSVE